MTTKKEIVMTQELEQAAKQWHGTHGIYASDGINKTIVEAFKGGAEWQKQRDKEWMEAKEKEFKDIRDTTRWVNKSIGYQQGLAAAKLTWEDVKQIVNIADKEVEGLHRLSDKFFTEQSYYEEVLKQYKEEKK